MWGIGFETEGDNPFLRAVDEIYQELDIPRWGPAGRSKDRRGLPQAAAALADSDLFRPMEVRRYRTDLQFDHPHYLRYMASFATFHLLAEPDREVLIDRLGSLIDSGFGGNVTIPARATLCLARPVG